MEWKFQQQQYFVALIEICLNDVIEATPFCIGTLLLEQVCTIWPAETFHMARRPQTFPLSGWLLELEQEKNMAMLAVP